MQIMFMHKISFSSNIRIGVLEYKKIKYYLIQIRTHFLVNAFDAYDNNMKQLFNESEINVGLDIYSFFHQVSGSEPRTRL